MIKGDFSSELSRQQILDPVSEIDSVFNSATASVYFAGKIFNRKAIEPDDTVSDAEAVFNLYKKHGIRGLKVIDGSFTVIIKDGLSFIIARDRHGTHNQIYYTDRYFSSSLYELSKTLGFSATPDYNALSSFLSAGYIADPNTAFASVRKLGAGKALVFSKDGFTEKRIYDNYIVSSSGKKDKSLDELAGEYGTLHTEAIKRRIEGKNNIGILLSGGYDSGGNLATLRKIYNGEISSYSIGFEGDNWSELPLARCMSATFGTNHHEYEINGEEITALPDIVKHLGDPFVEGGLMVNYCAMRMIGEDKPHVILGGDGSDQYFGTSGREVAIHYLISKYGLKPFIKAVFSILSSNRFEKNNKYYRIRFHLDKILNILEGDRFGIPGFILKEMIGGKNHPAHQEYVKPDTKSFEALYTQHAIVADIEKIIDRVILFKASRMAEMFNNNMAFPYMDNTLYDFLQNLPVKYKCNGAGIKEIAKGNGTAKFLLKYHYKPLLPEEITSKKKQGGFAPMPIFFSNKSRRLRMTDFIMSSSVTKEFLRKDKVEAFLRRYDEESSKTGDWFWYKQNKAIQYFNILTLSVWWEIYVNGNYNVSLD